MALAVPQPRSSQGAPKMMGGLPGVPGQGIDSSGGRFGAFRWWVLFPQPVLGGALQPELRAYQGLFQAL